MWARIENNKVMEIIDFNPVGRFTDELVDQFVECPKNTKQNMIHENGQFKEHAPTSDEKKQVIVNQLEHLNRNSEVEEIVDILVIKGILKEMDLPLSFKEKKQIKKNLKKQLQDLEL